MPDQLLDIRACFLLFQSLESFETYSTSLHLWNLTSVDRAIQNYLLGDLFSLLFIASEFPMLLKIACPNCEVPQIFLCM